MTENIMLKKNNVKKMEKHICCSRDVPVTFHDISF